MSSSSLPASLADLKQPKPRPFNVAVVHEEGTIQFRAVDKTPAMLEPGHDSNMSASIFGARIRCGLCT